MSVRRADHGERARIVARGHHELGRALGERHEGVLERLLRAVVIEVVGVDVGDQGDGGVVEQERAVGLVGLDDEELARSVRRAAAEARDHAAVHEARVGAELDASAVTIMPG